MYKFRLSLLFIFLLFSFSFVSAQIEMTINFYKNNNSIIPQKIFLRNVNKGVEVIKDIQENRVIFTRDELSANSSITYNIRAILCSGGTNPCSGYLFDFPLDKKFGNNFEISLYEFALEYRDFKDTPSTICSDKNLIYCSQSVLKPNQGCVYLKQQWENFPESNGLKSCDLGKIPSMEGLYFLESFCSDGLNSVLKVQPFVQKTIEIKNPSSDYVLAVVNLSKTSCVFQNGSKINNFSLNPNESIKEIVSCKSNESVEDFNIEYNLIKIDKIIISPPEITFFKITIPILGLGSLIIIFFIKRRNKKKNPITIPQSSTTL